MRTARSMGLMLLRRLTLYNHARHHGAPLQTCIPVSCVAPVYLAALRAGLHRPAQALFASPNDPTHRAIDMQGDGPNSLSVADQFEIVQQGILSTGNLSRVDTTGVAEGAPGGKMGGDRPAHV
jgi:hypothetical protein